MARAEAAAAAEASEDGDDDGDGEGGHASAAAAVRPPPERQTNLTDPDSALMRKSRRHAFRRAGNARAAVDADGSRPVLATEVARTPSAAPTFQDTVDARAAILGRPETILADAGFANGEVVGALAKRGIEVLAAVDRSEAPRPYDFRPPPACDEPPPRPPTAPWRRAMRAKLRLEAAKAKSKRRKWTVEPVFGILESVLGFTRFHLRGLANVKSECQLLTLAYNCKRLHKPRPARHRRRPGCYRRQLRRPLKPDRRLNGGGEAGDGGEGVDQLAPAGFARLRRVGLALAAPGHLGPERVVLEAGDDVDVELRRAVADVGDVEPVGPKAPLHRLGGRRDLLHQLGAIGCLELEDLLDPVAARHQQDPRQPVIVQQQHRRQRQLAERGGGGDEARMQVEHGRLLGGGDAIAHGHATGVDQRRGGRWRRCG
jgi:hypothetical protein